MLVSGKCQICCRNSGFLSKDWELLGGHSSGKMVDGGKGGGTREYALSILSNFYNVYHGKSKKTIQICTVEL